MNLATAHQVAEFATEGARICYATDGEVVPTMLLIAERNGIILHPNPELGERPPIAYAEVMFRVGRLYPWRVVATVSETWIKTWEREEPMVDIRQGQLAKMEEAGDPTVLTALMVLAVDLHNRDDSYSICSTVSHEPGGLVWDVAIDDKGWPEGGMPEMLWDAYMTAIRPPPDLMMPPLALIADVLVESEVATSALVLDRP